MALIDVSEGSIHHFSTIVSPALMVCGAAAAHPDYAVVKERCTLDKSPISSVTQRDKQLSALRGGLSLYTIYSERPPVRITVDTSDCSCAWRAEEVTPNWISMHIKKRNFSAKVCFTCHRDDKRRVHGVDAEGPGAGGQVEVGDEVGQLAKDQGPRVDAEERVLEQGEVQHFGLQYHRLARRAGMRGNSNNSGGTEVAIDLRQAVWSCGFALARVVMLGLVCIQTVEDLPGYFGVQQRLSGLLLFAPIVRVRSGGREGREGA